MSEPILHSLIAGTIAGAVEPLITYPTEFVKTRSQFQSSGVKQTPLEIIKLTIREKGVLGLYSGCGALVVGNSLKAGVRFFTYDTLKSYLADSQGKVSPGRSLLAGLGTGMVESIVAVTPSEAIKTKLIDDAKSSNPRFKDLLHGTSVILREQGMRGIYSGLVPVMMRQSANSAVRFTTYTGLKQLVQANARPGQTLPSSITFGIGAIAGLVTVYTTMPLDVIKTRMQSLEARRLYKNSVNCGYKILTEEGFFRFWAGTTPRLVRLVMSGGIVFTVYEKIIDLLGDRPKSEGRKSLSSGR